MINPCSFWNVNRSPTLPITTGCFMNAMVIHLKKLKPKDMRNFFDVSKMVINHMFLIQFAIFDFYKFHKLNY